ncbi:hypothetical protein NET02_10175 [Thermomicrobiaceae bacterium CFH 74404]|uniref:Uncharacterized protein n=1 Tax=Thermalbibacter longus TaxID=2951981 RepID=A0AA41WF96_9BACT|nr:hypothetical protein [Thermalbibacter longus]MCM8749514.1 hypothetical protein [Thermalbibacter longus]
MSLGLYRLVAIETRRNAGVWLVVAIPLVSWWLLSAWGWVAILWSSTNEQLQAAVAPFAVPAVAGVAAWMAGRDRRRGIEDLLDSTPAPPAAREIALWAATAAWGVLAYATFAAFMMARTALSATWGGPDLWRVAIVLAAILAGAAWGSLIGRQIPSRLTPPLVTVGVLGSMLFLANYRVPAASGGSNPSWVNYLAPDKTTPETAPWQMLLYTGLTVAALAGSALRRRRAVLYLVALGIAALLALAGAVMVWGSWPRYDPATGLMRDGWGRPITSPTLEAVQPVCRGAPVSVCVHPQYLPLLDEAVEEANRLVEPLLGLPGVPMRAEEDDAGFVGGGSSSLLEVGNQGWLSVAAFADDLVADPESRVDGAIVNEAQLAIRIWLIERARIRHAHTLGCHEGIPAIVTEDSWRPLHEFVPGSSNLDGMPTPQICQAVERFSRLSPAEQRDWLEAHYADLRAGRLALDDLP